MSARLRRGGLASALVLAGAAFGADAHAAATITVVNGDGPGEGFNDTTPAAPVGGNTGTTRGEQAFIVFQKAAEAWGKVLNSNVEIRILANFDPLQCTATGAVLGSAGPISVNSDDGFPNPAAWYVAALADSLSGQDLTPGENDINARFNSQLGQGPCAAFADWYYGLDGNPTGGGNDLASTVLHEFGHGLGFLTLVNKTTGALFNGQPDIWLFFMRDKTTNKLWKDMTNAERVASITNTGNLLWDGPRTNLSVPTVLGPPGRVSVLSPPSIAGEKAFGAASFGPPLPAAGLTGEVTLGVDNGAGGNPNDACEPLAPLTGKVAIVDRGTCGFTIKVKNAQNAGAIAVLVADNDPANVPPPGLGGSDDTITIPSVRISKADGDAIKAALPGGPVAVKLDRDPNKLAGANEGLAQIYSPPVIAGGSSASHFIDSAEPDLLMEPFSNTRNGFVGLDLTTPLFQDIGWNVSVDLAVDVTGEYVPGSGGGSAVFTIDVTNVGDGNVEGVNLTNATPAGLTYVSSTGACTTAFPCELGSVGVGATKRVVVTYAVPADYDAPNAIDQASVTSTTTDLSTANNTSAFTLTIPPIGAAGAGGGGGAGGTGGAGGSGGGASGTGGTGGGASGTGGTGGGASGTGGTGGVAGSDTGGSAGSDTGGAGGSAGDGAGGSSTGGSSTGGSDTGGAGGSSTAGSGTGGVGTGGSSTGGSSTGGKSGAGTGGTNPGGGDDDDDGCGCSTVGSRGRPEAAWLPALAAGLAFVRRRRRASTGRDGATKGS